MTTYYYEVPLGAGENQVKVEYEISTKDNSQEYIRTGARVPLSSDSVKVRIHYQNHIMMFQNRHYIGARNGTPDFEDYRTQKGMDMFKQYCLPAIEQIKQECRRRSNPEVNESLLTVLQRGAAINVNSNFRRAAIEREMIELRYRGAA